MGSVCMSKLVDVPVCKQRWELYIWQDMKQIQVCRPESLGREGDLTSAFRQA